MLQAYKPGSHFDSAMPWIDRNCMMNLCGQQETRVDMLHADQKMFRARRVIGGTYRSWLSSKRFSKSAIST